MTNKTYLIEEISEYLRLHPYTVRRLAREGKIPGFKVGGQWRFRKNVFNDWCKRREKHNARKSAL